MRKAEYLKRLSDGLKGFPPEVRQDIVADIREHFEMREAEGIPEEETASRLGDPRKLAKQFEVNTRIDKAHSTRKGRDITAAVLSAAGTGAASFFGVVIPSVLAYIVLIAFVIVSVCVGASGIALFVLGIVYFTGITVSGHMVVALIAVGLTGLGILLMIGSIELFRMMKKGILKTLAAIKNH